MTDLDRANRSTLDQLRAAGYTPTTLDEAVQALATMVGINDDDARLMLTDSSDVDGDD